MTRMTEERETPPGAVCLWPPVSERSEHGFFRGEKPRVFSASRMAYPPGPGRPEGSTSGPRVDLSGETFVELTVVERIEDHVTPSGRHHPRYLCRCLCGAEKIALGHNLTSWRTQTCGDRSKHPVIATGPKTRRMPNAYYDAVRTWAETGDDSAYQDFRRRWELYQVGRGPKP